MKRFDQRILKAVLGGAAVLASMNSNNPAVAYPVAFGAALISAGSIAVDTVDLMEEERQTQVRFVVRPTGQGGREEDESLVPDWF